MDCLARLHPLFSPFAFSSSSSSFRRSSFPAISRSFTGSPSTGRFASMPGAPLVPVVAQARRGSSLKEDEVASRKLKQPFVFPSFSSISAYKFFTCIQVSFFLFPWIFPFSAADLQFEPPLKIVVYPDPILRAKNKRIDSFDDNLKKLVHEMFDVMYK